MREPRMIDISPFSLRAISVIAQQQIRRDAFGREHAGAARDIARYVTLDESRSLLTGRRQPEMIAADDFICAAARLPPRVTAFQHVFTIIWRLAITPFNRRNAAATLL